MQHVHKTSKQLEVQYFTFSQLPTVIYQSDLTVRFKGMNDTCTSDTPFSSHSFLITSDLLGLRGLGKATLYYCA